MTATILDFPRTQLHRFFAVERVGPGRYRAASFIGWHTDPRIRPDPFVSTYEQALARARDAGEKMGIPVVTDRFSWRGCVWDGAA